MDSLLFTYRIYANSFRGNYYFLNLALTIKVWKLFKGGNYSRVETIRGNTVAAKIVANFWCDFIIFFSIRNGLKNLVPKVLDMLERMHCCVIGV